MIAIQELNQKVNASPDNSADWKLLENSEPLFIHPLIENKEISPRVSPVQGNGFYLKWIIGIPIWMVFILSVPFWAEAEEKWFRKGVRSWKGMTINSLKFGLMHLTAGIPLCWALSLSVPGFLFACRYKYVYDRHLRKFNDENQAVAAGVEASTADHAIYNAILITFLAVTMLLG
ncbi:hypothetical protein H6F77_05840 [Microcoleus sp. FACHB-831]|uniref:hypothetical protein n=1 Tax=Microcoleus sp. FACHB-831 TaxID=2692827 RepID=UPI001686883A|nr:hypothetical protein [Microcoleus sp. FACHB-831]MBD1920609.1 hypothetical protein [Microcoleus sp. FACHB-831]